MGKNKKIKTIPALDNSAKQQDSAVIESEVVENAQTQPEQESKASKQEDKALKVEKSKDKKKKEKKPSKAGKRLKETFAELKKVTWPKFPQVVKQTGIVLAVVVFFGLVLFGFDYILKFLFQLMTNQTYTQTELWATVGIACAIVVGAAVWLTIWLVRRKRKKEIK